MFELFSGWTCNPKTLFLMILEVKGKFPYLDEVKILRQAKLFKEGLIYKYFDFLFILIQVVEINLYKTYHSHV